MKRKNIIAANGKLKTLVWIMWTKTDRHTRNRFIGTPEGHPTLYGKHHIKWHVKGIQIHEPA